MADAAIFVGWGLPFRGREAKATAFFNESVQYWSGLQQKGEIESFEVALLDPHGGDLAGFALLRGSRDRLAGLQNAPDFRRMVTRALLLVENVGVVGAVIGQGLAEQMSTYQSQINDLT